MKKLSYYILPLITLVFLVSCSDDETPNNTVNTGDPAVEGNYFPSTTDNYWNYNVTSTDNITDNTSTSQDSLYVISNTATTLLLDVNDGLPANGPIIGLISNGTLTKSNTTLILDGALELPAEISDFIDFEIALNNFVLYNTEANSNTELSSNTNTITQDFNGFPLTINYQVTSTALGFAETLSLNGVTYSNVASSKMVLNINVSTTVEVIPGFPPIALSILDAQDILVSTHYFADGIGLVQANSGINYQISTTAISALEAAGVTLPIPASGSTTINQVIGDYSVIE